MTLRLAEEDVNITEEDVDSFRIIQYNAWKIAEEHGWHEDRDEANFIPAELVMIHSEVSETLEEYRNTEYGASINSFRIGKNSKPEGFGIELADIVIRVMNLAEELGVDLASEIMTKMHYNTTRPYRHGNKRI